MTQTLCKLKQPCPLILASASPRRAALLREAGYEFEVMPPELPEPSADAGHGPPGCAAEALAYFKARCVAFRRPDAHVLGADTIVVLRDRIIGKPRDAADARSILRELSGSEHQCITGIALLGPAGRARRLSHAVSALRMRRITDDELDDYIASGEWQGKAGAYAIQENGDRFIEIVSGEFSNVVGLPLDMIARLFDAW